MALRGFISYSHEDMAVCRELRKQLNVLVRIFDEIEEFWMDECNRIGRCFRQGYLDEIGRASIFVPLISVNWLNSAEIENKELPAIRARIKAANCLVLPAVVDACYYDSVPDTLLAAPLDDNLAIRPLLDWDPPRHGYERTRRQFGSAIAAHFGISPKPLDFGVGP